MMQLNQQSKVACRLLGLLFLQHCAVGTSGPYHAHDDLPQPSATANAPIATGLSRECFTRSAPITPSITDWKHMGSIYAYATDLRPRSIHIEAQSRIKAHLKAHYLREDFRQIPALVGAPYLSVEDMAWHLKLQEPEQMVKDLSTVDIDTEPTLTSQASAKCIIGWEDLFCPRSLDPGESVKDIHRVLLFGEAGMGKTALAKKLAHAWAKGMWGKNFDAVYVLSVGALRTGKYNKQGRYISNRHLGNAIINECLPQVSDPSECLYWIDAVKRQLDQSTTLVILDGLEEQWGVSQAVLQEAREGNHKLLLITRPHGIDLERECRLVDRVVENRGLDQRHRDLFISRALGDITADTTTDLVQFIIAHHLQDIVRVPIHLQMLCGLWVTQRDVLTQSRAFLGLSSLCRSFLQDAWKNFVIQQTGQDMGMHRGTRTIGDEHPVTAVKDTGWQALEKIALHSLWEGRLSISLAQMSDLVSGRYGWMLRGSNPLLIAQPGGTYMFSQRIFQEYLAGKRLARFFLSGKTETLFQFLESNIYAPLYRRMLTFMTGEIMQAMFQVNNRKVPTDSLQAIQTLVQLMSTAPREALHLQHLVLQLQLANEWLILIQGSEEKDRIEAFVSLEVRFGLGKQLTAWLEAGLRQYDIYEASKARLLHRLLQLLSEANSIGKCYSGQLIQRLQDRMQMKVHNTHLSCAVYEALAILGRYGPFQQIKPLLEQGIQNVDENIHRAACNALKTLAQHISFQDINAFLRTGCKHTSWRMRVATYTALGSLGQDAPAYNIAFLLQVGLQDSDESVRQAACASLATLGLRMPLDTTEILIQLGIQDADRSVREGSYDVLAGQVLPYERAKSFLEQGKQDSDEHIRAATYRALGAVGQGQSVAEVTPLLLMGLGDYNWRVRRATCQALARLASHISCETVMFFLQMGVKDKDWHVRKVAYEVLGILRLDELPETASEDARMEYLADFAQGCIKDKHCHVRVAACKSISGLRPAVSFHWIWHNLLRQAVEDSSWAVRYAAYEALGSLDSAGRNRIFELMWPALKEGMQHKDWMTRRAAYQAFKVMGGQASFQVVWPILQRGIEDQRCSVRHAAYEAIAALNESVSFVQIWPVLQKCMQHSMCAVREDAYLALQVLDQQGSFGLVWPSLYQGIQHSASGVCEAAYKALEKYPTDSLIEGYWELQAEAMLPFIARRLYGTALTLEGISDKGAQDQQQMVLYTGAKKPVRWRRPASEMDRFMKALERFQAGCRQK